MSYVSVSVAWVELLMWPGTNIFKIKGKYYHINIMNSYFSRLRGFSSPAPYLFIETIAY